MAKKASTSAKRKQPAAVETRESIEEQVQAFLAAGGKIQQVPKGVSGQTNTSGPRHITLGKKPRS
ncbi:hypothetical protein [Microbulbifer thermotolerans]|uniref:Transcriptional regulator SutA RNAP-binding domain-containing protein n=1 Tax=Microbulbifer thermotolerans TaxID=252514 RepID=A0AB35HXC8_MICTH|nr:hypothetical protein [Microbulbifer thermotolerans]MCX2779006.1 hypothetical protein [Microbulbifer thermotolerans]MCX2781483.1 hypothetical protein [Microbulbifer thermotolerans]MCX2795722.1 hypothetical protein [Microbulbifer thermotolerans]MCX2802036.1 hypothetical protein [Microbulbifer thermotolerans]MCX2804696.1 hypothetical protein [Microbulbifer thermotolerans]